MLGAEQIAQLETIPNANRGRIKLKLEGGR